MARVATPHTEREDRRGRRPGTPRPRCRGRRRARRRRLLPRRPQPQRRSERRPRVVRLPHRAEERALSERLRLELHVEPDRAHERGVERVRDLERPAARRAARRRQGRRAADGRERAVRHVLVPEADHPAPAHVSLLREAGRAADRCRGRVGRHRPRALREGAEAHLPLDRARRRPALSLVLGLLPRG